MPDLSSRIHSILKDQNGPVSILRLHDILKSLGEDTDFNRLQDCLAGLLESESSMRMVKKGELSFYFDLSGRESVSGEELIQELRDTIPGKAASRKYEKLGERMVRYLFSSHLDSLQSQVVSHGGTRRNDLQGTIHSRDKFWDQVYNRFGSLFITFEFKNHSKPVSTDVIHNATKYLNRSAQKNAILLISRLGISQNAGLEILNRIRQGDLLLSLSDEDMIRMIEMKGRGEEPSLLLYGLLVDCLNRIG